VREVDCGVGPKMSTPPSFENRAIIPNISD
jgi:hypothetical protein